MQSGFNADLAHDIDFTLFISSTDQKIAFRDEFHRQQVDVGLVADKHHWGITKMLHDQGNATLS